MKLNVNLHYSMVINKIEEKTMYLYRKWVWLGVELGHRDLISLCQSSCLLLSYFYAISVQVAALMQEIVHLSTKMSQSVQESP